VKVLAIAGALVGVGAGVWRSRRDPRDRCLAVYSVGYFATIVVWSYQAPRYALLLFPLFVYFFVRGIDGVSPPAVRRGLFVALAVLSTSSNGPELARSLRASWSRPVDIDHGAERWLADRTPPDEPIVTMGAPTVYFFSGRRGVPFVPSKDLDSFVANARRFGLRYFLTRPAGYTDATPGVADPILEQHRRMESYLAEAAHFERVYESPSDGARIYRLKSPPSPRP
jgi:hypothetical protein